MPDRRMDAGELAHTLVARFLSHHDYRDTLAALVRESRTRDPRLGAAVSASHDPATTTDWNDVVEDWIASRVTQDKLGDKDDELNQRLERLALESSNRSAAAEVKSVETVVREATNVLNVARGSLPTKTWDPTSLAFKLDVRRCVFTSSVDRTLKLWSHPPRRRPRRRATLELLETHSFESPVLSFVQHPEPALKRFVACATMEGRLSILDLVTRTKPVQLRDHSKYIVTVVWSNDGRFIATLGYDKLIHVYRVSITTRAPEAEEDPTISLELAHTLHPRTNPEAAVFLPDSSQLVWTARDDHLLHYLSLPTTATTRAREPSETQENKDKAPWDMKDYNLNPNRDSFTSFSILSISTHPTLPVLSLQTSTDHARVLLYPFESDERVKTIHTGAHQSDYFHPRHRWTPDGTCVVVNSEDGVVRVCRLDGRGPVKVGCHGLAAPLDDDDDDDDAGEGDDANNKSSSSEQVKSERAKARRERDRGSSVIRDVEVVQFDDDENDGEEQGDRAWAILTAGFDKTVRMIV